MSLLEVECFDSCQVLVRQFSELIVISSVLLLPLVLLESKGTLMGHLILNLALELDDFLVDCVEVVELAVLFRVKHVQNGESTLSLQTALNGKREQDHSFHVVR